MDEPVLSLRTFVAKVGGLLVGQGPPHRIDPPNFLTRVGHAPDPEQMIFTVRNHYLAAASAGFGHDVGAARHVVVVGGP